MATIEIIGSQPGDHYSTPQAWYDDHKGNIVADPAAPYIGQLRAGSYGPLVMSGSATDAGHYFHLQAYPGDEFRGDFDASYPVVTASDGSGAACEVTDQHVRIEHIVVRDARTLPGPMSGFRLNGADDYLLDGCGVHQMNGRSSAWGIEVLGCGGTIRNCAIGNLYCFGDKGASAGGIYINAASFAHRIYHCSFHEINAEGSGSYSAAAYGLFAGGSANLVVRNCAFGTLRAWGDSTGSYHAVWTISGYVPIADIDCNALSVSQSVYGTHNQWITPGNEFVDAAASTMDLHLRPTSVGCRGHAGSLAGYAGAPSVDIDSQTLGADIGCDTCVVADHSLLWHLLSGRTA
jgi:hypothetical protein